MKVRKWIFVEIFSLKILPQHHVNMPDRRQTEYFKSCDTKACLWIYTGVCVNICILLVFVFLHCSAPAFLCIEALPKPRDRDGDKLVLIPRAINGLSVAAVKSPAKT